MSLRRLLPPAVAMLALLLACRTGESPLARGRPPRAVQEPESVANVSVRFDTTPNDTAAANRMSARAASAPVWRGVYQRDRGVVTFRVCGTSRRYFVRTTQQLRDRLDADVAFSSPQAQAPVFAQVRGDAIAGRSADSSAVSDTILIVAIDTVRSLESDECRPERAAVPPPLDTAKLEAATRRAVGADTGQVRPGSYAAAAVWLDRDFQGDALVLVKGGDLCNPAGCTLLAFQGTPAGDYVLVSRTIGVKAPVYVLQRATGGWQDLGVTVGLGVQGSRLAQLSNRGRGYPPNAALEPDVRALGGSPVLRP